MTTPSPNGSKADALDALAAENTPARTVIPITAITEFLRAAGVTDQLRRRCYQGDRQARKHIQRRIEQCEHEIPVQPPTADTLILRSSTQLEDGTEHSFAGVFSSKKTNNAELQQDLKSLIIDLHAERVRAYLQARGIEELPQLAVIVQEYLSADHGGVMFTTYQRGAQTGVLINSANDPQDVVAGGACDETFITEQGADNDALPAALRRELERLAQRVEAVFGTPQDVEWLHNGELVVLQSRPITAHEEYEVWDNSNIAESYSGVVLPLTYTFIKRMYRDVYKEVARTSAIDEQRIKQHEDVFEDLIGSFYGRVYYNMNNWYKMLALFPGYERNKRNFEDMISAQSRAQIGGIQEEVTAWQTTKYYANMIYRLVRFEHDMKRFQRDVKQRLEEQQQPRDAQHAWKLFRELEEDVLPRWSITVDNDFLAMTLLGTVDDAQDLTGIGQVASHEQLQDLADLAQQFRAREDLAGPAREGKYQESYKRLLADEHVGARVQEYYRTYGGRQPQELRLESKHLDEDPQQFITLLLNTTKPPQQASAASGWVARRAQHYLRRREENRLLRARAFARVRKLMLAIADELVEQQRLHTRRDIFYLTREEVGAAAHSQEPLHETVDKRKQEYDGYRKLDAENVLLTKDRNAPAPRTHTNTEYDVLYGTGASGAQTSGRVTVLTECDFRNGPYDVVVTKHTDPGWTPMFGMCNALVVERGGVLSHAAILARELGLTCVIGVDEATSALRDGQRVTVDAVRGEVRVED